MSLYIPKPSHWLSSRAEERRDGRERERKKKVKTMHPGSDRTNFNTGVGERESGSKLILLLADVEAILLRSDD